MKNTFTFLLVLLIVVQVNAQSEKYAIKFSNELINHEQSMRDKREKILLKYHQEKDIYKTHLIPNQNKQYKQPLSASVSKTVNCTAGNLSTLLTTDELNTVTDLTITGTIDARDFKTMRDKMPVLAVIDLSATNIVSYTGSEGTDWASWTTYPADEIPEEAFYDIVKETGKLSLTTFIYPKNIKKIGYKAFKKCSSLMGDLNIPKTVETIGGEAFLDCKGFNGTLTLSDSLKYISLGAFGGCENLKGSLIIPSKVEEIDPNAFSGCYGLNGSLILNQTVKVIGDGAFAWCYSLKGEIFIPSSISSLGEDVFIRCDSLSSINIPASVLYIGSSTFGGCGAKLSIDENNPNYIIDNDILYTKDRQELLYCHQGKTGDIIIPSLTTTIHPCAFWASKSNSISIPPTVTQIIGNPFQVNLGEIQVDTNNPNYASIDGILFNKNKNILISCPTSKDGVYTISSGVDTIGFAAFCHSSLSSITIPSSINIIGSSAFEFSNDLKSIYSLRNYPVSLNDYEHVFNGVNKQSCYLYVPKGFKNVYQVNLQWKDFINIIELTGLDISSSSEDLQSSNNHTQVNIITNNSWTASSNQPWLTVTPTFGTDNATLTLTAEENNTTAERTGIVTVSTSGLPSKTITVKQAGKATGIEDLYNSSISVYPNPAKQNITITGFEGVAIIEIFNINGELKMKYVSEANKPISVVNIPNGLYILKLKTSRGIINKKLIVD